MKWLFRSGLLLMLMNSFNVNAVGWREGFQPGNVVGENYSGNRVEFDRGMERQDQLLTVFIYSKAHPAQVEHCTGTLYGNDTVLTDGDCIRALSSNWSGVNPVKGIYIQFYKPQAVIDGVSVFKFLQDQVFQAQATYLEISEVFNRIRLGRRIDSYTNFADKKYYETIEAAQVFPINRTAAVVLRLKKVPDIVTAGTVSPFSMIRIANYRDEAIKEIQEGKVIHGDLANYSDKAEIMGFGFPNFAEDFDSNTTLSDLPNPEKLFLNLRSHGRGLPLASTAYLGNGPYDDCFNYTFLTTVTDYGDIGGSFYWYDDWCDNNRPCMRKSKKLLGIIHRAEALTTRGDSASGYYTNYIQGFSHDDIAKIYSYANR